MIFQISYPLQRKLPIELEEFVFDLAGPLTQWLCRSDRSLHLDNIDDEVCAFWKDVFRLQYRDFSQLPVFDEIVYPLDLESWCVISSRKYYKFLWDCLSVKSLIPKRIKGYSFTTVWDDAEPYHPLIHAALRHCWVKEFSNRWFRNHLWRMVMAVAYGHIDLLKSMIEDPDVLRDDAIQKWWVEGSKKIVGYYSWFCTPCELAASKNRIDVLTFFLQIGIPKITVVRTITRAARTGAFKCLKWLHSLHPEPFENTIDFDGSDVMHNAAMGNNYWIVKFLHENRTEGCKPCTLQLVKERGHERIVEFLANNRPEFQDNLVL